MNGLKKTKTDCIWGLKKALKVQVEQQTVERTWMNLMNTVMKCIKTISQ